MLVCSYNISGGYNVSLSAQWNVAANEESRAIVSRQADAIRDKYRTAGNEEDASIIAAAIIIGGMTATADGPLPFGDLVGGVIIVGGVVLSGIVAYYAAVALAEKKSKTDSIVQASIDILKQDPNATIIYRSGNGNLHSRLDS